MRDVRDRIQVQVAKAVVGLEETLDHLVAAIVVGGHVLLEGVPGVAKTLLANATARAVGLDFRRVQFTPDMLPSDLTGTMVLRGADRTNFIDQSAGAAGANPGTHQAPSVTAGFAGAVEISVVGRTGPDIPAHSTAVTPPA